MSVFLDISHQSGRSEEHKVDGRVIVGSGDSAGISIPYADDLEPEHLLVHPRERGCWISVVQGARTPTWLSGARFDKGFVDWGASLAIGGTTIRVRLDTSAGELKKPAVSLPMLLGLGTMVPLLLWLFSGPDEQMTARMTTAEPPVLLAVDAVCPADSQLLDIAQDAALNADAKRVRYHFDPHDGVEAYRLYGVAMDCFQKAGKEKEAAACAEKRERLANTIDEDYRTRRLSLERMIKSRHARLALKEARVLLAMLGDRKDPYTRWLRSLEQKLSLRLSKRKSA